MAGEIEGGDGGNMERPTKITFGEMRDMGVRGLLIYCAADAQKVVFRKIP